MASIGLRPALLFFSLTGVNTAASISARKLSNGTTRAIISSGSPFAESPQAACQHRRIQIAPSSPHSRILLSQVRLAQIRGGRYFSRCPILANSKRVREEVEHSGNDIAYKGLSAQPDRDADDTGAGEQRPDVDA